MNPVFAILILFFSAFTIANMLREIRKEGTSPKKRTFAAIIAILFLSVVLYVFFSRL